MSFLSRKLPVCCSLVSTQREPLEVSLRTPRKADDDRRIHPMGGFTSCIHIQLAGFFFRERWLSVVEQMSCTHVSNRYRISMLRPRSTKLLYSVDTPPRCLTRIMARPDFLCYICLIRRLLSKPRSRCGSGTPSSPRCALLYDALPVAWQRLCACDWIPGC